LFTVLFALAVPEREIYFLRALFGLRAGISGPSSAFIELDKSVFCWKEVNFENGLSLRPLLELGLLNPEVFGREFKRGDVPKPTAISPEISLFNVMGLLGPTI